VCAGCARTFQNTATLKRVKQMHFSTLTSSLLCDMIRILQFAICFMPNEMNDQNNAVNDSSADFGTLPNRSEKKENHRFLANLCDDVGRGHPPSA
jgi:hypothetical protein